LTSSRNINFSRRSLLHGFSSTGFNISLSVTLRKEPRQWLSENRVLRKIFGPTWGNVAEDWTSSHYEELYGMYCSPNIMGLVKSTGIWWARRVTRVRDRRGALKDLVERVEGSRQLGIPRHRWKDNIKMVQKEQGCGLGMD
jgi:hypothetical protein